MLHKTTTQKTKELLRRGAHSRLFRSLLFLLAMFACVALISNAHRVTGTEPPPQPELYISSDNTGLGSMDKNLNFEISAYNADKVRFRIFKLDMLDIRKNKDSINSPDDFLKLGLAPVKEWTILVPKKENDDYTQTKETVPNPGPGMYLLVASAGETNRMMPFYVSDISMISKRDGEKTIFFVQNRFDGKPVRDAKVITFANDTRGADKTTDAQGLAIVPGEGSDDLEAMVEWDGHIAFMNVYNWYGDYFSGYKVYTVTDRPVYRPGHEVNYKATVRFADGSLYRMPDIKEVEVEIKDPKDNTVIKEKKTLNEFGALSGTFTLAEEPALGTYWIYVYADDSSHTQSFVVEEYRKPEYEVSVTPSSNVVIQGDKLAFDIDVKYYFGEPVKDADVEYEVTASPRYWYYWGWSRYSWYYDDDYYYDDYYGGDYVLSDTAKTDDKGRLHVEIDTEKSDYDLTYRITASVTDKSRRQVTGSGSAMAARAQFNISAYTDRYMYRPADTIKVSVNAADHNGNPVADRKVDLNIVRVEWDYTNGYERIEHDFKKATVTTDENGDAIFSFVPDVEGYFSISANATDDLNNHVEYNTSAYVAAAESSFSFWGSGSLEIVMDKDSYKKGDVARALITGGRPGASALVSVEANGIYKYAVLEMSEGSALFEFEVTEQMQPNVFVTASFVQSKSFENQSVNVVVPPDDKFLDLEIVTDKPQYKPGERAQFTVKAKDDQGNPAAGVEVSLGVVDEAIYALRPENAMDIRQFFYGRRWNKIETSCSTWHMPNSYYDYDYKMLEMMDGAAMPEEAMAEPKDMAPQKGNGDGRDDLVKARIRVDFRDTAFWGAHLTTNADGTADASFLMPDSLTTWRATARGISSDTKVGNNTSKTIVRKNLLVRLETPRFFTQDDEQNITAIVHNYLSTDKQVTCQLSSKGIFLDDAGDMVITVPAGGDVRVEWHGKVQAPQTAWVTVKALTNEESDAMQLKIPVLPHGLQKWSALAGEAEKNVTEKITLPDNAVADASTLRLSFAPSIAASMFESLDYLIGYPYGCVEQTMSRFLPDVIVEQAMQKLGLPESEKLKELPKMVNEGLQRLYDYQHDDGGWGWWKHDETQPFMTAYVVYGLTQAISADYSVDMNMYERGVNALKVLAESEEDHETLAFMLYALDVAGEQLPERQNQVLDKYKKLNAYSQALLAIVLQNQGKHDTALGVIRNLEKFAKTSSVTAKWEAPDTYGWMDNTVETTAYVLKALLAVDPDNPLVDKTVRYLTTSRKGDHWYSTKDTAAAVMALTDFMLVKEDLKPDLSFTVKVNGKQVHTGTFKEKDIFLPAAVVTLKDEDKDIAKGENVIEITRSGSGKLYYTARLNYFAAQDKIQRADNGIYISRYYSFDEAGKKKLSHDSQIKPGDEIYVHLNVRPSNGREYIIIEDMLPSGFEVVREEQDDPYYYGYWSWWYPQKEIRDERVIFFATSMYDDNYDLTYRIRAEVPGVVNAMPATAWLMYFPEVGGNSDEKRFTIVE